MFRASTRVGGELVRYPVCFSSDEKVIFSCVGGFIKAHNAITGALQGEYRGHTARVTGVYLNPLNTLQLYSTSHDGTICRWDPLEGVCLQRYKIGIPVLAGSIAAGHHLYVALDPTHYTKFLPAANDSTALTAANPTKSNKTSTSTTMTDDSPSKTVAALPETTTSLDIKMPSQREEQHAKNLAHEATTQKAIYICAFNLLTPQNTDISTDFFSTHESPSDVPSGFLQSAVPNKQNQNQGQNGPQTSTRSTLESENNPLQLLFTMKEFTAMARSRNGDLLCAVGGKEIHVYSKSLRTHGVTHHPHPITCVDIHPKQDLIAVGDITGRITLYVNANSLLTHSIDSGESLTHLQSSTKRSTSSKNNSIVSSSLHWHSHPVRSAKFSVDGNYLLSGGYEGVLVTWQLSNMTSHFLPRLSSFIQHIAVSSKGGVYALSCGDNSIQTLGAYNSQLKHVAHGVNILNPTNRLIATPQVKSLGDRNTVILITDQGHFQVFNIAQDLHVCTFDLLDRNLLPETQLQLLRNKPQGGRDAQSLASQASMNSDFTIEQQQHAQRITTSLDITKVLVSPDGRWSCGFYEAPSQMGLRIWAHSSELVPTTEFVSRTVWHDTYHHRVICGTFATNSKFLVTGHSDGRVRFWGLNSPPELLEQYPEHLKYMGQSWVISNTIEYQGLPPTVAVLSNDMTILAIGFGNTFTLWSVDEDDSFNATFLFAHTFAGAYTEVLSICFLPGYPTIYVATQHGLYTFDLLTLSCVATYFCNIASMVTHPVLPLLFVTTVVPLSTTHKFHQLKQNNQNTMDDSDFGDSDDETDEDAPTQQQLTRSDDYLGDEVDALLAQSNNVTPGATGGDINCPIYRRIFKYLYRTHVINRYIDQLTKHIPSLRTLPQDKVNQAQKELKVKLPPWAPTVEQRLRAARKTRAGDSMNDDDDAMSKPTTKAPTPAAPVPSKPTTLKHDLLTKPTKECCLLVFSDNKHDQPEHATSLYDVMLTKTKITNTNNNPYNSSCYEASINLTQDFFTYLNRSRELTMIPITPAGLTIIQKKEAGTIVTGEGMLAQSSSVLQQIYNLETHSAKLEKKTSLPSEFTLTGGIDGDRDYTRTRNPKLDSLLSTLANTPTHQITSLSSIYEQFMNPFLPTTSDKTGR